MRLMLTLPIVVTLICGASACSDPAEREAKYMRRGMELFDQEDFQKARLEFRNAGRINPTDPEVRYRLGLVDEAQGDLPNAVANFVHTVEQDPHHRQGLLKLAQYSLMAERYDDTQKHLNAVLADHPDDAEAHALLAALALRRNDFDETEKQARFALKMQPGSVTGASVLVGLYVAKKDEPKVAELLASGIAHNPRNLSLQMLKVAAYRSLNEPAKVEEAYRTIFSLKPAETSYRIELADFFASQNRFDEAEAALREAVAAAPANWDIKRRLVLFLSEHRGLEPAETEVRTYMTANPDRDDLLFWLADLYVRHQAADRAIALLEEVVAKQRLEPPGLNARTSLAKISFARGDRVLAEKLVSAVLEKAPGNHDALLLRSGLEFDQGRYQTAVADLRSVLRDRPRDKDALQMLAEALAAQGHSDLAVDTLGQLAEVDPSNRAVQVRLAQMYHVNGESKRALELLASVNKADPSYSIGWESKARVAVDIKDWPTAEEAVAKLEGLKGQTLTANYLRGTVLAGTGKLDEAISQFTQVAAADPNAPLAEHALTSLVASSRTANRLGAAAEFIESLHSENPFVATLLGQCYADLGRTDDAVKTLDAVIAAHVGRPEAYVTRARLFLAQQQPEPAMDVLKKGQAAVPNNVEIPMMLAELLGLAGRYQEAEAIYEDLLGGNPALDAAANNLAELIADYHYADPVVMDMARRFAERFQGSTNPLMLDTLGWVYYRQGKLTQAVTILERAMAAGQVPAQVHYHYGAVLSKLNQHDQARVQLEEATRSAVTYVGKEDAERLLQSL